MKREVESWILEQHVKPLYMAQNDQTVILSQHLGEQKAAMVKGKPSKLTSNLLPLKICGTKQQSARVGVLPKQ